MELMSTQNETNAISAIRVLSADMIQKANSGHPGLPLGAAAMAYTIWGKEMAFFSRKATAVFPVW